MSVYDDKLDDLREHRKDAWNETVNLEDGTWPSDDVRFRFQEVLAYAEMVLAAADPKLISDDTAHAVRQAFLQIANDPSAAGPNADAYANAVLDALARLPSARGTDVEQAVKEAGANFQRSVQQRLNALNSEFQTTQQALETFRTQMEQEGASYAATMERLAADLDADIKQKATDLESRYAELHARAVDEQAALSKLRTTQTQTFEEAEEQRAAASRKALEEAEEALRATEHRLTAEVKERVAEIRRMESESAQLVGAIGLAGTAERYAEEVIQQKSEADRWRYATVVFALLAVAGAVFALAEKHPQAETFAGKLTLSLILGGVATYAARQSAYHRHREQRARDLQLELTAFAPFIEPLSPEQQEEERVIMTRKTFGKTTVAQAAQEEPGPTPLSLALREREKADAGA